MKSLYPCLSCKHHIRLHEARCPFCGAACRPPQQRAVGAPRGRPGGRAALFLAAVASGSGGCDKEDDDEMVQPVYGIPIDASSRDATPDPQQDGGPAFDAGLDATGQPVYGVAIDAGPIEDAGTKPSKDAATQPVYGIPIDASVIDAGRQPPKKDAGAQDASYEDIVAVPVYGLALDDEE